MHGALHLLQTGDSAPRRTKILALISTIVSEVRRAGIATERYAALTRRGIAPSMASRRAFEEIYSTERTAEIE